MRGGGWKKFWLEEIVWCWKEIKRENDRVKKRDR